MLVTLTESFMRSIVDYSTAVVGVVSFALDLHPARVLDFIVP